MSRLSRLADFMYGPAGAGRGENAYLYGPQYTGRFDVLPGWRPDLASQVDPDRAVGYFRFNTGNTSRDALLSILANEFGLDNYIRAVQMTNEQGGGREGFKKAAFKDGPGAGALGQVGMAGFEAVGIGGLGKAAAAVTRGATRIPSAVRAWRAARAIPSPPVSQIVSQLPPSALNPALTVGQGLPSSPWAALANTRVPGAPTVGGAVPTRSTRSAAAARAVAALRNPMRGVATASDAAADAGLLRRAGSAAVRRIPEISLGATAGMVGYGLTKGEPRPTATEARNGSIAPTSGGTSGIPGRPDVPIVYTPPRTAPMPPRDLSTQTNKSNMSTTTDAGAAGAGAGEARMNIAAIQQQYNNVLRDLRSMYNKSETDLEKEQIRRILADIEAQRDAGLTAIRDGYASTSAGMRTQAEGVRADALTRGQEFGGRISGVGSDLEQRLIDQQALSAQDNRGLGVGAANIDPTNEWVNLINTIAPMQQNYTQGMGELAASGVDWLANTVDAQGLAQQGDLQRLAAATRSGAQISHDRRVGDRVQRETELERQALQSIMMASLSAQQSANQFNAGMADRDAQLAAAQQEEAKREQQSIAMTIVELASSGRDPAWIQRYLTNLGLPQMNDQQFQLALDTWHAWRASDINAQIVNPYAPPPGSARNSPAWDPETQTGGR